jgi:tetraacyldisaccharide 4'-kinase
LLLLKILTWLYWLGYQLRKGLYGSAIIRPVKTGIPVISVGNLTWGGTGKTSLVIYLASRLERTGKKVVVLTRGYGRKSKTQAVVEKKGLIEQKWRDCGDEPFLICQSLQNTAVVTNSKRVKSAEWAKKNLQPDVFILDDGFQHWKLHRDLDLVLVDSASPFGNGKLIPSGILREPLQALKRGDVVAITKVMDANKAQTVGATIKNFTDSPLVYTRYKLRSITELVNRRKAALDSLMDKEILAFCGIGNPESFYQILEQNRLRIVRKASFPDHYGYETLDLFTLEKEALKAGADYLATTAKDALKIPPNLQLKIAVLIFEIAVEVISGEELLWQKIDQILNK